MHYAAMANDPTYLEVLLAHRADPNAPNGVTGATPLMSALMGDREVQFRALLDAGAKPDLADRFDNTSLHVAAKVNAYQRVLDLLHAGADPAARNRTEPRSDRRPHRVARHAGVGELRGDGRVAHPAGGTAPDIKMIVQPVEGLGVPAISNQAEGDQVPALAASAKGLLVALRSSSLEVPKALAAKAIARLP